MKKVEKLTFIRKDNEYDDFTNQHLIEVVVKPTFNQEITKELNLYNPIAFVDFEDDKFFVSIYDELDNGEKYILYMDNETEIEIVEFAKKYI